MSAFLTNPDKANGEFKRLNISFDYKESVTTELQKLGVPLRPAELACIDLGQTLKLCWHAKLTPKQTAGMMISQVEKLYKTPEGTWHYG